MSLKSVNTCGQTGEQTDGHDEANRRLSRLYKRATQ